MLFTQHGGGEEQANRDFFSASGNLTDSDDIHLGLFLIRGRGEKMLLGVLSQLSLLPGEEVICPNHELRVLW